MPDPPHHCLDSVKNRDVQFAQSLFLTEIYFRPGFLFLPLGGGKTLELGVQALLLPSVGLLHDQ